MTDTYFVLFCFGDIFVSIFHALRQWRELKLQTKATCGCTATEQSP